MSQHRPECGQRSTPLPHFIGVCICEEIKRAEQRVLETIRRDSWFEDGWNQALDAAREAVVERSMTSLGPAMQGSEWVHTPSVLAAIDALREERK